MEEFWWDLVELLNKPAMVETFVDILLCVVPIWLAIMIGLLIGWSWRPRWTGLVFLGFRHKLRFLWTAVPPGFGARRLWLAFTALSAFSVGHRLWFNFRGRKRKDSAAGVSAVVPAVGSASAAVAVSALVPAEGSVFDVKHSNGITEVLEQDIVTENDLNHLLHLLDGKVTEKSWQSMMERSTSNLIYQAWRHEPERGGPVVYRTRTVFEDATPELVRDFFWDDDFRPRWDPMLAYFKILEEFPHTGTTIVHWIKKFPFFCSDREYIIGRRIWEAGKTFYCVTKGVPYPALQRRNKPRRVDLYFSSWIIKPVLSQKGDGQLSACEVTLVHYEDMGIPKDVARLGVRHGMWATVKKMHSGFRAYQLMRQSQVSLSRSALIARITTKISFKENADSSEIASGEEEKREVLDVHRQRDNGGIDWKWVAIGGAVALVCGLHTGVIGKALLLGAGQKAAQRRAARR